MRKKITNRERRRIFMWMFMILILVSYLVWFGIDYGTGIYANNKEKANLEEKYQQLLEEEKELSSEVIKLQDPDYVAKFARDKYLYSRPGELIIRIAD